MLRKIVLIYVLAAVITAVVTTILQVQPALFFIELLLDDDNTFPLIITTLLTMLTLLLPPLLLVLLAGRFFNRGGNYMPDLTGKTGIVVRRERLLANAVYPDNVMVNGEKRSTVSNGKSTFVELIPGEYKIFVKGSSIVSPVTNVLLTPGKIVRLRTGYASEPNGIKTKKYLETDE